MKCKHGQRVTCTINGTKITDAKISIDDDDETHVCQDIMVGCDADNLFGYKYSWYFCSYNKVSSSVRALKTFEKTLETLEVGDIPLGPEENEVRIIGICDQAFFLSKQFDFTSTGSIYTKEDLAQFGYEVKSPKEVEELTMEEVCEELGRTVKIKK